MGLPASPTVKNLLDSLVQDTENPLSFTSRRLTNLASDNKGACENDQALKETDGLDTKLDGKVEGCVIVIATPIAGA